jgi:hypothetical protein
MTQRGRAVTMIIAFATLVATLGCSVGSFGLERVSTGALRSESVTVDREDVSQARVNLSMGAGDLTVGRASTDALMEADFTYNVAAWRPEVDYTVSGDEGRLTVRQPNTDQITIRSSTRYQWGIRLSDAVPIDLRIEAGAGTQKIDLDGLQITALNAKLGAGDASISVGDSPLLSRLDFDMGAGEFEIDLDGAWQRSADIEILGGVGAMRVRLPSDTGVRVTITRGIGDIETTGLTRDGSVWVNEAYGNTDSTLEINIRAGVGRIALDIGE